MAKKMEDKVTPQDINFDLDNTDMDIPLREVTKENNYVQKSTKTTKVNNSVDEPTINCLRNERIIIRHVPKLSGIWGNNPKHILSGGMAEGATRTFTVPRLSSGMFVNVLTDKEKAFLEEVMGLEYNALSVYKKENNFWDDSNEGGINTVRLTKQDNYLNLSDPEDYIRYKILLANKNFIAPSLQALQDSLKLHISMLLLLKGKRLELLRVI